MYLTPDDIRVAFDEATKTQPREFQLRLADYMNPDVFDTLMDATYDMWQERGVDMEAAVTNTAIFMTGVQLGWFMAEKALQETDHETA